VYRNLEQVAPFLPATVLSILFWELATVTWHVDQRNAVAMTEVHGGVQLPGGQAVGVIFTLVEIALVNEDEEENEVFGVPDIPRPSMAPHLAGAP